MQARLGEIVRLTGTTEHSAFTDLCQWHGRYYCAWREARTHNILPRGNLHIHVSSDGHDWRLTFNYEEFIHPFADLRDPKFLVSDDVLYLLCGAYLPHPAYRPLVDGVMPASADNLIQTHLTYTTDGETWSDLIPILRPQYWGWSGVQVGRCWYLASYHTGNHAVAEAQSLVLWSGTKLLGPLVSQPIYLGASGEKAGGTYRYPDTYPSEPVLWYDAASGFLGCAVRTEQTLHLGYGRAPYGLEDWRWHATRSTVHPSAILQTSQGWLLAGREVIPGTLLRTGRRGPGTAATCLYALEGHTLRKLLTLPSARDCGYAGLCAGPEEGTVLISWYSQHEVPDGLPGAAVYVATVEIEE